MKTVTTTARTNTATPTTAGITIGQKGIMAVTGTIILGWVFAHMAGNLQVFMGQDKINTYAELLKHMAGLTWTVRIILGISLILHIAVGVKLYLRNRSSRPVPYAFQNTVQASQASRSMIISGLLILFFVLYHLAHFTFMFFNKQYASLLDLSGRHDVYTMVILGFKNYFVAIPYMIAMFLLALHLSHGVYSIFQSLGFAKPTTLPKLKVLANIVAVILFLGFSSVPIAVLMGWIGLPTVVLQ